MLRIVHYTKEEERLFRASKKLLESHTCMCEDCKSARGVLDSISKAEAQRHIASIDGAVKITSQLSHI